MTTSRLSYPVLSKKFYSVISVLPIARGMANNFPTTKAGASATCNNIRGAVADLYVNNELIDDVEDLAYPKAMLLNAESDSDLNGNRILGAQGLSTLVMFSEPPTQESMEELLGLRYDPQRGQVSDLELGRGIS